MPTTTNPITDTNVTTLDWAEEPERKMQGLLQLFLERYFSGTPFQTRAKTGGLVTVTWPSCLVKIQEQELSHNPAKPVLDVVFDNLGAERQNRTVHKGTRDEWLVTVIAKVPASLAATLPSGSFDAEKLVRKIAAHVRWLFGSAELAALAAHGVNRVFVERPPTAFNHGAWLARIMTVRMETWGDQAR